jgi:hypothetical protein
MSKAVRIIRRIAAPIAGYAVIVVGTTCAFRLAHGINLESPPSHLFFGTMGILASGIAGGWVAGWVGGRRPIAHAVSVLIFLAIDSTTVLFFRRHHDPLWFGLMSALGLMAATVAGGFLRGWRVARLLLPRPLEHDDEGDDDKHERDRPDDEPVEKRFVPAGDRDSLEAGLAGDQGIGDPGDAEEARHRPEKRPLKPRSPVSH